MSAFRFGWRIPLPRPFTLGGSIWQSRRRSLTQGSRHHPRVPVYHGELEEIGWRCPHDHRRPDTAIDCARREAHRRGLVLRSSP